MIGIVDAQGRALLDVPVSNAVDGSYSKVTAWIDTAFDGHLVCPTTVIQSLDLQTLVETEAILADGSKVTLETLLCFIDWFGERTAIQVIANEGKYPLLGTGLLEQRVLHVDYRTKDVSLN